MQFIKEYVPDKRWQTGQRPVVVKGNRVLWILWKLTKSLEKIFSSIKLAIERSFKIVDDIKEVANDQSKN